LSLGFRGVDGETLLMALTEIAVSSGSACNSITLDPSHVLLACGVNRTLAASTLRLSFGRFSSETQLLAAAEHICSVIGQLRQNSL
jgi:cysteine desulfurase